MRHVDIKEVCADFSQFLSQAELGEAIVITCEGVPKAVLSKYLEEAQTNLGKYSKYVESSNADDSDDGDEEISSLFEI